MLMMPTTPIVCTLPADTPPARPRDPAQSQQEAVSRWRDGAPVVPATPATPAPPTPSARTLQRRRRRCGCVPPDIQAKAIERVGQRLTEIEAAIQRREFTTAVILLRVAVDTVGVALFGRNYDMKSFTELLAIDARLSPRLIEQLRRHRDAVHMVVHGHRNGCRRESVRLLRLFRVVGSRWMQRVGYLFPGFPEQKGGPA